MDSVEARYYDELSDGKVRCNLCPHHCVLSEGQKGICRVRKNIDGKLYTLVYGKAVAIHTDPIEKKPLFHFYPGSGVTSFATVGCNMRCRHCQNWDISQADIESLRLKKLTPEDPTKLAIAEGARGIAWTYNEPTIWYEYNYDASKIAKDNDLYTVYVTNGYIEEEPLRALSPYLDAMNIDVKAFTNDFYLKITGAKLEPVLETVLRAHELGIHIELTYLIITALNDSMKEIRLFVKWIKENIGTEVPVHFSRFHPDYMLTDRGATPLKTMYSAKELAEKEGLEFVYLGNVWDAKAESTYCPNCGNLLIKRDIYNIKKRGLKNGKCMKCGTKIYGKGLDWDE